MRNTPLKTLQSIIVSVILTLIMAPCFSQMLITSPGGSFPLFNGQDTSAWNQAGNANWYPIKNGVAANQGAGLLIGKLPFVDYQIEFSYWVAKGAQFSLFTHCLDPNNISATTALEIDLSGTSATGYGPGSIIGLIRAPAIPVSSQWNTISITSESNQISVILNGITVANKVGYSHFTAGPFAIELKAGDLKIANFNAIIPGRW